jgi:hypothetical protein
VNVTDEISRRDIIRTAGLSAAAITAGGALFSGSASAATQPSEQGAARTARLGSLSTNNVNLYCRTDSPVFDSSGNATVNVTIGNLGPDSATGSCSLKFLTAFYVNVPALPPVPSGSGGSTPSWLYQNTATNVPSLFQMVFPAGIAAGASYTVPVAMTLDSSSPDIPPQGRVVFTTDAANTTDVDSDISRNVASVHAQRSVFGTFTTGNCELYYTADAPPAVPSGPAVPVSFNFFNGSGTLLSGTKSVSYFTFSTPFYCGVPSSGRPPGLSTLYSNGDPAIPSIYQLTVPAGVGLLGAYVPSTATIPLNIQRGAPRGGLLGAGIYVPSGDDTQGLRSVNHHKFGIMSVTHAAA